MAGTVRRVGVVGVGLAVVFGAAYAMGAVATPLERGTPDHGMDDGHAASHADGPAGGLDAPAGLAVSAAGYSFVPAVTTLERRGDATFRFAIVGPTGRPLTAYEPVHTKDLHLIVVRRDLSGFQHVHPTRDAAGTWSVPLDLSRAGTYRAYADFQPAGRASSLTLGVDLQVPGRFDVVALPAPKVTATVDGFDVTLRGTPVAGTASDLTFTVERDGEPVKDLDPYLGAFGHLVSLRTGDLAYLHTHPLADAQPGKLGGPEVTFMTEFATAGTYRLFLDFSVGGTVRTAEFTLAVGTTAGAPPPAGPPHEAAPEDHHATNHVH